MLSGRHFGFGIADVPPHPGSPGHRGEPHLPEGGVSPASTPGGLDTFEGQRPRLTGLAYRITGSLADTEDVVPEGRIRRLPDPVPTARGVGDGRGRSVLDPPVFWPARLARPVQAGRVDF
jgi:hypothetical protein